MIQSVLCVATLGVYARVVAFDFVIFDDWNYVYQNEAVRGGLNTDGVRYAFTDVFGVWSPLTMLSLMLDVEIYGVHPAGFHFTNLVLHIANALLLFSALERLTRARLPSALAAAVFALHPLHVESVAWIAERKDVLSGFFFMLILYAYAGYAAKRSRLRLAGIAILYVLGLLAKPMLVTLPFLLLLLDYWPLERFRLWGPPGARMRGIGSALLEKAPLIALGALVSAITFAVQDPSAMAFNHLPLELRLGNAATSYLAYMGKAFFPSGLAPFYPHPEGDLDRAFAGMSFLVLIAISLGVYRVRGTAPYLLVGWLWFVGLLVPVIGLVQVGNQAMADRYMYLPLTGLSIMLIWGVAAFIPRRFAGAVALASGIALLVIAGIAARQVGYWRDTRTLFEHTLRVTEKNYLAHNALGWDAVTRGEVDRARGHFARAVRLRPGVAQFHRDLSRVLSMQGQDRPAQIHLEIAREIETSLMASK